MVPPTMRARCAVARCLLRIARDHLGGVAGNQGRRIGIRSIQQDLHAGGSAASHITREARQHADHAIHLPAVEQRLHLALVSGSRFDNKVSRAFKLGAQVAALRSIVLIHPRDVRGIDVQIHGIAENQQLHQRRNQ